MASRKEQKGQARAARIAAEQAAIAKAARTRHLGMTAGLVIIAAAVVVALVAISPGGGNTGLQHGMQESKTYQQVNRLLTGIPENGTMLGNPGARYTLTFFGDLQCPICAEFATGATGSGFPEFVKNQVRTGKAKIVYRSFCTATCNDFPRSLFDEQQAAAYAAGKQNKFWYYEELFYRQQGTEGSPYVTPEFLKKLASQIPGLNLKEWAIAHSDRSALSQLHTDDQAALKQLPLIEGGRGTPGLIMTGPKGSAFIAEGIVGYSQLQAALKTVS